jgi:phosphoribosylanthranilate isomerase
MESEGQGTRLNRVRVKICGITDAADAHAAVAAGADALGFVFYAKSPRSISVERAAEIIRSLPPFVARVGLFVNETAETIQAVVRNAGLDTVQLHGEETPEFAELLRSRVKVIKAFRVRDAASLASLSGYIKAADAYLLDAFVPGIQGGTGSVFDWQLAIEASRFGKPIILAGGLTVGNVTGAVAQVRPYAVDVSSGVEISPGRKDPAAVTEFIGAAWRGLA